jgi:hypothetical protein
MLHWQKNGVFVFVGTWGTEKNFLRRILQKKKKKKGRETLP